MSFKIVAYVFIVAFARSFCYGATYEEPEHIYYICNVDYFVFILYILLTFTVGASS